MYIKLAGEEINMSPTFANISKVESVAGSIFGFAQKLSNRTASFTDIVNIYYFMQDGTAYSQEIIAQKIRGDGLATHLEQVAKILTEIFIGNDKVKDADAKKKEEN